MFLERFLIFSLAKLRSMRYLLFIRVPQCFKQKDRKMKLLFIGLVIGGVVGHFGPLVCAKKTGNVVASVMHGTGNVIGSVAR